MSGTISLKGLGYCLEGMWTLFRATYLQTRLSLKIAGAALAQHQAEAQGMSPKSASRAAHPLSKVPSSCKSEAIRRSIFLSSSSVYHPALSHLLWMRSQRVVNICS